MTRRHGPQALFEFRLWCAAVALVLAVATVPAFASAVDPTPGRKRPAPPPNRSVFQDDSEREPLPEADEEQPADPAPPVRRRRPAPEPAAKPVDKPAAPGPTV